MSVNLQKILFGLLFSILIIFFFINSAYFQKKITTKLISNYKISNNTYLSVDDLDYNFFNGNFYTDLYLIQSTSSKPDTLLTVPNLSMKISFLNFLFSNDFQIKEISVNNPLVNIIDGNKLNNINISSLFSSLSLINSQLSLSSLELINVNFLHNHYAFDGVNIKFEDIFITKDFLDLNKISITSDSSFVKANCIIKDQKLNFDIIDSHLYPNSKFYNFIFNDSIIKNNHLSINSNISINSDSILLENMFSLNNNQVQFNISGNSDSLFFNIKNSYLCVREFDVDLLKERHHDKFNFINEYYFGSLAHFFVFNSIYLGSEYPHQ